MKFNKDKNKNSENNNNSENKANLNSKIKQDQNQKAQEDLNQENELNIDDNLENQELDEQQIDLEKDSAKDQNHIEFNLKKENKILNHKIKDLMNKNNELVDRIKTLENQINLTNLNYKNDILKKSQEAQNQINLKLSEYQAKYDQELKHYKKYALKEAAIDLIDIINNFELAVNSKTNNEAIANYLKGFQMFLSMFKNFLNQNNINEINVNVGDEFDAAFMQAFETEKKEGFATNKVIKVLRKGYKLFDIVIVPTTVIVSQ
ncbi:MAG: nucleotide exchange factor GrpE [Malacoplasma sp.]|nr:nucleotide exchange factor GrpE [Malacoplasma sp.]